jgi:Ca2+/Na+ antiporter
MPLGTWPFKFVLMKCLGIEEEIYVSTNDFYSILSFLGSGSLYILQFVFVMVTWFCCCFLYLLVQHRKYGGNIDKVP